MLTYEQKIEKSLSIIREANDGAIKAGTPLIINFSGEKNSLCILELTKMVTDNYIGLYMSTELETPGLLDIIKEEAKRYNLPLHISFASTDYQGDLYYWVRKLGYFPRYGNIYCFSRLKFRPARAYLRKLFGLKKMYRITGMTKTKNKSRKLRYENDKNYYPIKKDPEVSGSFIVEAIVDWEQEDMDRFLSERNITPLEYMPYSQSTCFYCPYYTDKIYEKVMESYPDIYDKIIDLEKEINAPAGGGNKYIGDIKNTFIEKRKDI